MESKFISLSPFLESNNNKSSGTAITKLHGGQKLSWPVLTHATEDFTGFKEIKKVKEERMVEGGGGGGGEGGDLHVHFLV